jgi:DNA-binding transcriptional regulator YdaS (Cro superfamily)
VGKSKLAFLLGVSLSALFAMWLKAQSLAAENELLEAALSGVVTSMAYTDEDEEPLQEWGE